MLGKKMNNKETFESLKMDKHIIDIKTFEQLKDKYIYTFKEVVAEHTIYQNFLKIDIEPNDNQPIQLLCEHEAQDERNIKQLSTDFERLNKSEKNNQ